MQKQDNKASQRKQAHGLTADQLVDLQQDQIAESASETSANTAKKETIKEADAELYHVKLQIPGFSQTTGKPLHAPFIQQYTEREFLQMKANNGFAGYEVEIIHAPAGATAHKDAKNATNTTEAGLQDLTDREQLNATYKELYGAEPALTMDAVEVQQAIDLKKQANETGETVAGGVLGGSANLPGADAVKATGTAKK